MTILPESPHKGQRELVKSMLIISRPKVGKTRALMQLPNSLLLDLEDSSEFYDGTSINIDKLSKKFKKREGENLDKVRAMMAVAKAIKAENEKLGHPKYKFGIIDSVSEVENICEDYATHLYKQSPIGKNYTGNSVIKDLEFGGGYLWLRDAVKEVIAPFFNLFETLILVGHVKDGSINKEGKSISVTDVSLTGKLKGIIAGKCDAIGIMYRTKKENVNTLSFVNSTTDIIVGARPTHLANKKITISKLDPETDQLTTFWEDIFVDLKVKTA